MLSYFLNCCYCNYYTTSEDVEEPLLIQTPYVRDFRDFRETRETRDSRETRETRDSRDTRDTRETRYTSKIDIAKLMDYEPPFLVNKISL